MQASEECLVIMNTLVHIYECGGCVVTFTVEQAFEEQHLIQCPVCCQDAILRDVGEGEIVRKGE
jgi:predicted nucleic acid-binding Zn ribbon protein